MLSSNNSSRTISSEIIRNHFWMADELDSSIYKNSQYTCMKFGLMGAFVIYWVEKIIQAALLSVKYFPIKKKEGHNYTFLFEATQLLSTIWRPVHNFHLNISMEKRLKSFSRLGLSILYCKSRNSFHYWINIAPTSLIWP